MYELAVGIKMLQSQISYDFLYIPQLWDTSTASVQATADLQIYL